MPSTNHICPAARFAGILATLDHISQRVPPDNVALTLWAIAEDNHGHQAIHKAQCQKARKIITETPEALTTFSEGPDTPVRVVGYEIRLIQEPSAFPDTEFFRDY